MMDDGFWAEAKRRIAGIRREREERARGIWNKIEAGVLLSTFPLGGLLSPLITKEQPVTYVKPDHAEVQTQETPTIDNLVIEEKPIKPKEPETLTEKPVENLPLIEEKPEKEISSSVDNYIRKYTATQGARNTMGQKIGRVLQYDDLIRNACNGNEALYRIFIGLYTHESGGNVRARSSSGAVGLGQNMRSAGKDKGLTMDRYEDQRRDPETVIPKDVDTFESFYREFGSLELALAAWNGGPTRVRNLVEEHDADSFEDIRPYLPGETQKFVPQVLARAEIATNLKDYDIEVRHIQRPQTSYYHVRPKDTLYLIAARNNTTAARLRELNPQLVNSNNLRIGQRLHIPK